MRHMIGCNAVPVGEHATVKFAAAEDVILKKLWFYQLGESDKHLRDIAGMLKISGARIATAGA